jgi:predicted RNA-binding Zn-ribbon protein involved in translation (DUF1610 family)
MKLFKKQEAQQFVAHGKALVCPHCGHDRFWTKKVLLNSSISTFFGFDWADRTANCFACEQCGRLEWFVGR